MARGPEFERVSTTLVNAYVAPRIARYVGHLQEKLRAAGYGGQLLIMQSTGGVMPPDYVVTARGDAARERTRPVA